MQSYGNDAPTEMSLRRALLFSLESQFGSPRQRQADVHPVAQQLVWRKLYRHTRDLRDALCGIMPILFILFRA